MTTDPHAHDDRARAVPGANDGADDDPEPGRRFRTVVGLALAFLILFTGLIMQSGQMDSLAQTLLARFTGEPVESAPEEAEPEAAAAPARPLTFAEHQGHPHRLFEAYLGAARPDALLPAASAALVNDFRDLLSIYEQRQGEDDNFTIRVLDGRTGETLELFSLDAERARYKDDAQADWARVDKLRREQTRRLVSKYVAAGVPKQHVMVRWGRANQVREARYRDLPYIEYEMALVRSLGLSLLATEIGTVETFNQDWLVSPVGAKSRYQMMPYLLRKSGIQHYRLSTGTGRRVNVWEEWHPLLTMEPAMLLVRGYVNAVGHEIPGISAYHTGPYNVYKLYRLFLSEAPEMISAETSVMDAYMWAVTEGFDTVSRKSSFKTYSRGYVPSAYGALRATEDMPLQPELTVRAERVQLRDGRQVFLSELLDALAPVADALDWGLGDDEPNVYNRFRRLNPHFDLPATRDSTGVPTDGDVRLVSSTDGSEVRFFLPIGATAALKAAGRDVIDPAATFVFDETAFAPPRPEEIAEADRRYDALVKDIERFGFNKKNYDLLMQLRSEFAALAEQQPTPYRKRQLQVIRNHADVWRSDLWQKLANAVQAASGLHRPAPAPPDALGATRP